MPCLHMNIYDHKDCNKDLGDWQAVTVGSMCTWPLITGHILACAGLYVCIRLCSTDQFCISLILSSISAVFEVEGGSMLRLAYVCKACCAITKSHSGNLRSEITEESAAGQCPVNLSTQMQLPLLYISRFDCALDQSRTQQNAKAIGCKMIESG